MNVRTAKIHLAYQLPSIAIVLLPGTPERSGQGSPEEDLQLPAPLRLDLGLLTPALGLLLGGPHTLPSIHPDYSIHAETVNTKSK